MRLIRKSFISLLILFVALSITACAKTETTNEIVIEIEGLNREYNYFLLNDTHIFIGDDEIHPDFNNLVVSRIDEFSLNGYASSQNFDKWVTGVGTDFDGIILNADIIDQKSYANLKHVSNVLLKAKVPYMYLQSDHDLATDWTIVSSDYQAKIDEINEEMGFGEPYYTIEEKEFIILGINYSWMSISEQTLNEIKEIFAKGKPIIIVTHVPYDSLVSSEISDKSKEVKGDKVLLWGTSPDDYYYPNQYMLEYLNMVTADDSPVVAVVGAHLHITLSTMLTDTIPEYITGTGYGGVRTDLKLVPKK